MLTLTFLIVVAVLAALMIRGSAAGPLASVERLYLTVAPLPAVLALVLPGLVSQFVRESGSTRSWALRLNEVGGWLSVALIVIGAMLLGRRSGRGLAWDHRLLIGLFVAALPAILIGLVALMYAFI